MFALLGERAPPVAITEHIRLKEKPKWPHKVQPWSVRSCLAGGSCHSTDRWFRETAVFSNQARSDGLLLKHWRKKKDVNAATFPATPAESNAASEMEQDERIVKTEPDYHYAKFNVKLPRPEYTNDEYETHFKSEDWDKSETDYLMGIAIEYDLRWIVIADRYEYTPSEQKPAGESSMAVTMQAKTRTMEDMKARYYNVAAKIMALRHPMSSMSNAEFEVHEKMTKFDPKLEAARKKLAETLLSRSLDEVKEEESLLAELKRMVSKDESFSQERKELYARLEVPYNSSSSSTPYSSTEIHQVLSNLLNQDKIKKRRFLMESGSTSISGQQPLADRNQRQSMSGHPDKRGSLSGPPSHRQLTPQLEQKFGVTHHERLSAGVLFRHEKVLKLSQAKSNAITTKIATALTELNISGRLVMPTAKVVSEYERLIQSIYKLLDIRRVSDKLDAEIKIVKAQKELNSARERGEKSVPPSPTRATKADGNDQTGKPPDATGVTEVADSEAEEEQRGDDAEADEEEEEDAEGEEEEEEGPGSEDEEEPGDHKNNHGEKNEVEDGDENEDEDEEDEEGEGEADLNNNHDKRNEVEGGDENEEEEDEEGEGEGNNNDVAVEPARASVAPSVTTTTTRKRSASVMSMVSNKSSKRPRKL